MVNSLSSGQGHVSVGDSAEEFILIHALGRKRLLVMSCGLPSNPLKLCVSSVGRRISDNFCLRFLHTAAKCVLNNLIGARHKSPTVE